MRVKLTVAHPEAGGEARTYVFEQDTITIGRSGTCNLPLDDPDRVVSKEHAQIRHDGDGLRVFDLGSKNQTFVDGTRVGTDGLPVADGGHIQLGPFQIDVQIDRGLLVADDLDRTVFGAAFVNPFQETAEGVATALGQLRRAYAGLEFGHRGDALEDALRDALGPGPDAERVASFVRGTPAGEAPAAEAPAAEAPAAEAAEALAPSESTPELPPEADAPAEERPTGDLPAFGAPPPASVPADAPGLGASDSELLHVLAAAAARLVSIPGQFRHEFLGHTVIHAPETAFLFDADVAALVAHLAHTDPAERSERHRLLGEAAEAVLMHHQAILEGYRDAARAGAAALIDALDPDLFGDEIGAGGLLPGARERALLDAVRQRCAYLRTESFAAAERRVYRPAFIQAYLDSVARATTPADS